MKKIIEYKINDDGNCKNCSARVSLSSIRLETFCLPFKTTTYNYQQCQECKEFIFNEKSKVYCQLCRYHSWLDAACSKQNKLSIDNKGYFYINCKYKKSIIS